MCLIKIHWFPKRAKEDIEVYKVVLSKYEHSGIFITPFTNDRYQFGETIYSSCPWWYGLFYREIEMEGVHAYQTPETAQRESEHLTLPTCVKRAIIPKGAFYWLGDKGDIASSEMIVLKE